MCTGRAAVAVTLPNASVAPSGDQVGSSYWMPSGVTDTSFAPTRSETTIRPARTNATREPSGEIDGFDPFPSTRVTGPTGFVPS